jgi:hypothetical protein
MSSSKMEKLLRSAVLETDALLKSASPVDTGRFRASWQVGENAAPAGIAPPGDYGNSSTNDVELDIAKRTVGNVYSVHNNLPYAEPLAGGPSFPPSWKAAGVTGSKQAPAGWVQGIAKDVQGRVIAAAAKIGRES